MSLRKSLEEKLNRFEELERQLVDPEVLAQSGTGRRRCASTARSAGWPRSIAASRSLNQQIAETQEMIEGKDAEMREMAEAELPELRKSAKTLWDELLDMTIGGEDAQRDRVRDGDPRRHRRRRGGPVRPRPVRNVQAPRRGQGLEGRSPGHEPHRAGRVQGNHPGPRRRGRLSASCSTKAAATACSASPKPRPRAASTPRPPPWPCCPSRKTSKSTSSPTTSARTSSTPAAPAGSTSTRPPRPSA